MGRYKYIFTDHVLKAAYEKAEPDIHQALLQGNGFYCYVIRDNKYRAAFDCTNLLLEFLGQERPRDFGELAADVRETFRGSPEGATDLIIAGFMGLAGAANAIPAFFLAMRLPIGALQAFLLFVFFMDCILVSLMLAVLLKGLWPVIRSRYCRYKFTYIIRRRARKMMP